MSTSSVPSSSVWPVRLLLVVKPATPSDSSVIGSSL